MCNFAVKSAKSIVAATFLLSVPVVSSSAEDLLIQFSSTFEVGGNRWPSMSIARFDTASENADVAAVLSDLFLVPSMAVGENNIGFYGGLNVIEAFDASQVNQDSRLGAIRTDLDSFTIDLESGYSGELVFVDGNRVRVSQGSTARTVSPDRFLDITQADIGPNGDVIFFDKSAREIGRADSSGSYESLGIYEDLSLRQVRDLKLVGDSVAVAAGWGYVDKTLVPSSLIRIDANGDRKDLFLLPLCSDGMTNAKLTKMAYLTRLACQVSTTRV